jgi:hypothetical protein
MEERLLGYIDQTIRSKSPKIYVFSEDHKRMAADYINKRQDVGIRCIQWEQAVTVCCRVYPERCSCCAGWINCNCEHRSLKCYCLEGTPTARHYLNFNDDLDNYSEDAGNCYDDVCSRKIIHNYITIELFYNR